LTADHTLRELVGSVREVISRQLSWAETAGLVADRLRLHLPTADLLPADQRYGDPLGYCSHVVHAEPDGSFSIAALVWRSGQATPIHDHITWCVTGVIEGGELEDQFALRDGWLEHIGTSAAAAGTITSLVPPGDIHLVRNSGSDTTISLHIYGTDLTRLGSSVRRTYDQPVMAPTND